MIFGSRHRRALLTILKFMGWTIGNSMRLEDFDDRLAAKRGGP